MNDIHDWDAAAWESYMSKATPVTDCGVAPHWRAKMIFAAFWCVCGIAAAIALIWALLVIGGVE